MQLLKGILKALALNGPVAWAGRWHNRVMQAQMYEWFGLGPVTMRDVLPWGVMRPVLVEEGGVHLAKQQPLSSCCLTSYHDQAQQQELPAQTPFARASDSPEERKS